MLGFVDSARFPLQFHPTFPSSYLHSEGIFETFQELKIVCLEQLQGARTLKLQSTCISHWSEWQWQLANEEGSGKAHATSLSSATVPQCPLGPIFRRLFDVT